MDLNSKIIPLHLHPLGFVESFIRLGASLETLLEDTQINKNMIDCHDIKISYHQFNNLIRSGVRQCNIPGIGFLVGRDMDWSFQGTLGSIVYCSPSMRHAFDAYFRFVSIAQPFHLARLHERSFYVDSDDTVVEHILPLGPPVSDRIVSDFGLEFNLAIALRLGELCGNKLASNSSVSVCLEFPEPAHADLYRSLPVSAIHFGCENSTVSAHTDFIVKPWRKLRRAAYDRTISQCEEELKVASIETTLISKVRWLISTNYLQSCVTLENIAAQLHMTPRSLTRKLTNEGASFRNLYHEVRMEMTSQHLTYSKLGVESIARVMRFSSVSSLRRAVKNWCGETVSSFRGCSVGRNNKNYASGNLKCESIRQLC